MTAADGKEARNDLALVPVVDYNAEMNSTHLCIETFIIYMESSGKHCTSVLIHVLVVRGG